MSIRQSLQLTSPFLTRLGLFFGVFENCPRRFMRQHDVLLKSAILLQSDASRLNARTDWHRIYQRPVIDLVSALP